MNEHSEPGGQADENGERDTRGAPGARERDDHGAPRGILAVGRLYLDALTEGAEMPETSLRPHLLTLARSRRRPAALATGYGAPYAARVAAMDALLASASGDDWSRVIVEGWTLQELVAHLAATDSLVAASVGAEVAGPPLSANDTLGRTDEMLSYQRRRSPEQTRADWRDQADAICRRLATMDPARQVDPGGMSFPVVDHVLARTLETWIHTDDAAQVIGLRLPLPTSGHISPVADLCARLVPWTMMFSGLDASGRSVRVTMTGPGGGTWHVPLDVAHPATRDADAPAEAEITCDVVELCFLFGGRGTPAGIPAGISGDAALARDVLTAAPALSGP